MEMCMNNELPVRKNLRLEKYDYSNAGYYFVTICVKDNNKMLGKIVGAASCRPHNPPSIELSKYGEIAQSRIVKISEKYPHVRIDCHVVMPNHLHMILVIQDVSGRHDAAPTVTLGKIMGYYKYQTTKEINIPGFWQRSYHDRIIRDEDEYKRIWQYIDENPARWAEDDYFI